MSIFPTPSANPYRVSLTNVSIRVNRHGLVSLRSGLYCHLCFYPLEHVSDGTHGALHEYPERCPPHVLMVTIFAIIIVSILVGIMYKKRRDAEKKTKGSGA